MNIELRIRCHACVHAPHLTRNLNNLSVHVNNYREGTDRSAVTCHCEVRDDEALSKPGFEGSFRTGNSFEGPWTGSD
jgi:hypothetical protein